MQIIGSSEGLYSISNLKIMKFVQATLEQIFYLKKMSIILVRNNEVLLIDEHTGRTMPGRRMSEGVHQALNVRKMFQFKENHKHLHLQHFKTFLDYLIHYQE